ncbi:MAG: hypothetical protein ACI9R7_001744 [Lysobacterales bacterium]|jgi:hypothetical protein
MKMRTILFLLSLFVSSAFAHDQSKSNAGAVLNKDGSIVTGILAPIFNPAEAELPFPHNLFFNGTGDLTLNIPIADPTATDAATGLIRVLNSLDGFSTTEKWLVNFKDRFGGTGSVDPSSVTPGNSVRVFQVTAQQILFVTGIVRELVAGVDYWAQVVAPGIVAIIPLKPLPEYSTFMVVMTNDIKDAVGNDATPDTTYHLSKQHTPFIDANFQSTTPLLDDATARSLEGLRQITASMEGAAAAAGINHEDIVLSYTVQTQSISPTLRLLRSIAQPSSVIAAPTGLNTAAVGAFGLADIVIGVITLPYYLGIPSAANPIAPLTDWWTASPGAYVPPFDQFGFDPTSTHITAINPFPVLTGMQTVPVLITVPNANSGMSKPEGGWPVIIYQHGITRNRTDMLALADAFASVGYVGIAIDQPLHGVVPAVAPELTPFYIENTPFGAFANERTFDADYFSNTTGAPGPDGTPDSSGTSSFNLASLLTARDNLRQATADLSILAVSLQNISVDGDQTPDLNSFNVGVVIHSLGTTVGVGFAAIEPIVSRAYINAATGSLIRTGVAGSFGAQVNAGLAAAGIFPGTALYEQFLTIAQTAIDSGDGINYASEASAKMPILHNMVIGDQTVPNQVAGAPNAGSEAVNQAMGLTAFSSSQANPDGIHGVARFNQGEHSSLFRPTNPAVTAEMQGQMASFIASGGTFVLVSNESVLVPVLNISEMFQGEAAPSLGSGKKGRSSGGAGDPPSRVTSDRRVGNGGRK